MCICIRILADDKCLTCKEEAVHAAGRCRCPLALLRSPKELESCCQSHMHTNTLKLLDEALCYGIWKYYRSSSKPCVKGISNSHEALSSCSQVLGTGQDVMFGLCRGH